MKINASESIGGVPILEVRRLVRLHNAWNIGQAMFVLKLSRPRVQKLIRVLLKKKFVEPFGGRARMGARERAWQNTPNGNALANSSAAPLLKRETAERALGEFLRRVRQVNCDEYWLWKVDAVELFGSMLSDKTRVSDVDIAIKISRKLEDHDLYEIKRLRREAHVRSKGKVFSNILERLFYPRYEVLRYLKGRSRVISLHLDEFELLDQMGPHRQIFP